jgi:hypothetical protein
MEPKHKKGPYVLF